MTAGKTTAEEPVKKKLAAAELSAILTKLEKPIRSQLFETAIVLEDYGKELLRREGTETAVDLSGTSHILKNCRILTHNHPNGTSLSSTDVSLAIHHNIQEIRCFGTEYRYSLRPGKSGWGITPTGAAQEWKEILKVLTPKYQEILDAECEKTKESTALRNVTIQLMHEVMQILAKRHNFIYRRNKW
jgi:hypothetical protein